MNYVYSPHVTRVKVTIDAEVAQQSQQCRSITLTVEEHGHEVCAQFTDLIFSAIDLATAKVKP